MTTPNSTISEPYKHLTIAKAYIARQIAPWRKRHIWVWSVSDVSSWIRVRAALPCWPPWSTYLKQLRLSVLNEMHTNSYSGPILLPIMEQVFKVACPIIYLLTILQSQWNIPVNKSIRISYVGWGGFSAYWKIPVFSKNRFFGFAKP